MLDEASRSGVTVDARGYWPLAAMDASSSSLEGSVAAVLSEVLNINVDNSALAKRVVAAARKGTIESFAVVCASFGA